MQQLYGQCNRLSVVMHDEQGQMLGLAATSVLQNGNTPTKNASSQPDKFEPSQYWDAWTSTVVTLFDRPPYGNGRYTGPLTPAGIKDSKNAEESVALKFGMRRWGGVGDR
eukprot:3535416-Rhodomonas_salina.1